MAASCGTQAGYFAHRRRKEQACADCKAGFAEAARKRRRGETTCLDCGLTRPNGYRAARYCPPCASRRANVVRTSEFAARRAARTALVHVGHVPFTWLPAQHEVMRRIANPVNWNQKPRDWWTMFVTGPCSWCGENFTARSCTGRDLYCSARCGKAAHKLRHGRFTIPDALRLEIYERDGWMCGP